MTRMSRGWLGGRGPRPSDSRTCQVVTSIFILQIINQYVGRLFMISQQCAGGREVYNFDTDEKEIHCPDGTIETHTSVFQIVNFVSGIATLFFGIYWLVIMCRTRDAMRRTYGIPTGECGDCEDFCCSFWCPSCTVSLSSAK